MNTEISSVLAQDGKIVEWAENVKYRSVNMTPENAEISEAMDAWLKETVGRTGTDPNHEIAQMIMKAITPAVVAGASEVIDRAFDTEAAIGEFDDARWEIAPKNTIKVHDGIVGGNVNRSYIDFKSVAPTWKSLQAETEVTLQEIRRGGYRTVAELINKIREALDAKKMNLLLTALDGAVGSTHSGYFTESTALPTETSAQKLALYLMDVADENTNGCICFGQNKYIQAISGLTGATTYLTDREKSLYNANGLLKQYAGMELFGYSGTRKLPGGDAIVPSGKVFGVAGKVGKVATRGETVVLQETDINSEKIHIKVNGYSFGYAITDAEKAGKIVVTES